MTTDRPAAEVDPAFDPDLDLYLERHVDVAPELVWAAWTTPDHITKWFTPAPWTTPFCEMDVRPGGVFRTVMRSPEGDESDNAGCILAVDDGRQLVWTTAMGPGFRPTPEGDLLFSATITIDGDGSGGTTYTVLLRHADAQSCARHAEMGFAEGWGAAFDQLVALVRTL